MPQASAKLRAQMDVYFNNGGINDWEPLTFLLDNGWTEKGGLLTIPEDHAPTLKEWDCAQFLCDEWDYVVVDRKEPRNAPTSDGR